MIIEIANNLKAWFKTRQNNIDVQRKVLFSTNPAFHYLYCRHVHDSEEIWKALSISNGEGAMLYQYLYCLNIKYRMEMVEAISNSNDPDKDSYMRSVKRIRRE